jgi:hypothetical protein
MEENAKTEIINATEQKSIKSDHSTGGQDVQPSVESKDKNNEEVNNQPKQGNRTTQNQNQNSIQQNIMSYTNIPALQNPESGDVSLEYLEKIQKMMNE